MICRDLFVFMFQTALNPDSDLNWALDDRRLEYYGYVSDEKKPALDWSQPEVRTPLVNTSFSITK